MKKKIWLFSWNFYKISYFRHTSNACWECFSSTLQEFWPCKSMWNLVLFEKIKFLQPLSKKIKKLRLYTIVESFLKGIEPSTIGWSPMLFPWATGTCFVLFIFVGYSGISNWKLKSHDVHTEHLQAKGLFEGSKLAGIFLPFSRRISFIFAGSSWTSFVKVFWSKFRHSSRTQRMTAAIVSGRGDRNTCWAKIAKIRSMGQKSSNFDGNQKGSMWGITKGF